MKSLMDYETWQRYIDRKLHDHDRALSAYDGHDTVCACMVDDAHHCIVGTSTSGLFMKHSGRLGDTPCIGCGFYADDTIGAAAATGVGEAICKGVLSYGVLQRIRLGQSAQAAASSIVSEFTQTLKDRYGHDDAISLIVVDKDGHYGVGTNVPFGFVVNTDHDGVQQFLALPTSNGCNIEPYHGQLEID